ncbi:hypothetical protein Tco_0414483 [Tanacetum coccineum]
MLILVGKGLILQGKGFNAVKPSSCWILRPIKPNSASLAKQFRQLAMIQNSLNSQPHNKTLYELLEVQDENDATKKSPEDSSLKDNGTADQQVNIASPEVNTGSRDVSTAVPEVNTATPEDLVGPSHASEDTQVEFQEIELGNIPQSYAEEPKRVSKALSDPAWVEAIQEELLQFKLQSLILWIYLKATQDRKSTTGDVKLLGILTLGKAQNKLSCHFYTEAEYVLQ